MKSNRLTAQIIKPIAEVFAFTIEPKNASRWMPDVVAGDRSDWQLKAGSTYRLQYKNGEWKDFDVVDSDLNKIFELQSRDGNYHIRYSFKPINSFKTDMEFFEWVDDGDIEVPLTNQILTKLRMAIELKNIK
ncbi:hypothetical protein A2803_02685 [Candidatus Woesebacteria bacterium RIFCSPHIGHO2_01_FULL_44_21]|uniref:Polyketide cyclase n=1 Tax=Candidatus Woesebacteria bacterium RIFCSPHIGHO2_01_FULL_44_21 TaxID=1802503 RepID=A0A1F7YXF8_9BACT|nr:MAG: hypothetical protein A2803_02685 [Candidatus Woesebacteria bacterium RIFCSPHIGHO2_01_FULL_44_21]OGM69821.1 MAG: hypothetical protein A2897_00560 [Candidatus Woesebacteria bacterium RIFCSPLOWO2_01_FULL_44_24b]